MGKVLIPIFMALVLPVAAMAGDLPSPPPLLFITDSDRALENQIRAYLNNKGESYRMELQEQDGDLWLSRDFNTGAQRIRGIIDSQESGDGERCIRLTFYPQDDAFKAIIEPDNQARFHTIMNAYMRDYWAPQSVFLDGDDDLTLQWVINIPHGQSPIHPEQVYDALVRSLAGWEKLFAAFQEASIID